MRISTVNYKIKLFTLNITDTLFCEDVYSIDNS